MRFGLHWLRYEFLIVEDAVRVRCGFRLITVLCLLVAAATCRADINRDILDCQAQSPENYGLGQSTHLNADYCAGIKAFMAKDFAGARPLLERAVAANDARAMGVLGYMYEKGRGVNADPARAFGLFKRAADLGNGDAMHELARCYQMGIGVAPNQAEAEHWLKAGEEHGIDAGPRPGSARAQPDQADVDAGTARYQAKDYAGAMQAFRRAADAGNTDGELKLGVLYEFGYGVAKSDVEAVRWYRKAADAGNAGAEKNLGQMYENGQGVPENWALATQLYQKSAAQGNVEGEAALGRSYEFGIGIEQNRAEAVKWFTRASSQGDSKAAYFAKFLSDPTNFIGFRNQTEHDFVIDRLRFAGDFIGGDPGRAFASSKERDEYLIAFKASATFHEAQAHWGVQHNDYLSCMGSGGGSSCHNPGPPPAIH
jgi:TPR repeat protein